MVTPALRSAPDSACSAFRSSASKRSSGWVSVAALLPPRPPSAAAPAVGAPPAVGLTARPEASRFVRRLHRPGADGDRPVASYAQENAALRWSGWCFGETAWQRKWTGRL